jgi:hypothetical protein
MTVLVTVLLIAIGMVLFVKKFVWIVEGTERLLIGEKSAEAMSRTRTRTRTRTKVKVVPDTKLTWQITECSQACAVTNRSGKCNCVAIQSGTAVLKGQVPSDWSGSPLDTADLIDRSDFKPRATVFVMWVIYSRGIARRSIRSVVSTYLPGSDESNEDIARTLAVASKRRSLTFEYKGDEIVPSCPLGWMLEWESFADAHEGPDAAE